MVFIKFIVFLLKVSLIILINFDLFCFANSWYDKIFDLAFGIFILGLNVTKSKSVE
ncbi:hypothetical protein ONA22_02080 [Mycoplasmopsis cynos]|uniref:hypothetical protein n=1 Tax=Mycoplasmopsis cynos TaxID=171284 RepID=UPI0024C8E0A4|nr:hypothetical protein [Mycoplasmopsis cynos]WAM03799.1 hypothetical protein ONA22_02080 [Mycoplasmopsis cynos]